MNRLSYCGLVDAKVRASDKDLPVHLCILHIRKKIVDRGNMSNVQSPFFYLINLHFRRRLNKNLELSVTCLLTVKQQQSKHQLQ